MASSLNNRGDVLAFIRANVISYKFRGHLQKFLPASALDMITKREVIRQVIAEDKETILNNQEQGQLVDRVHKDGRKLFATWVGCDKSVEYLKVMLENGLTDASLPLREDDFGSLSQKGGFADCFMAAQKRFNTVFFHENQFIELIDDHSDCFSIPVHFEEIHANFKGRGAFGAVYQVKIHPDQRSFTCETNDNDLFAMKSTPHEGRELNYHRGMAGQEHPHLVKCLTSFTLGAQYHMVYELANCNLESFIGEELGSARKRELTAPWLAQQLAGLAGAVQVVHNPETSPTSSHGSTLGVPSRNPERSGYIHDIKPENILVYKMRKGTYLLRLSDFSCARVAEFIATVSGKRDSYKTGTKSGTPIYRAPESLEGATSRPYDMWSLGCVYLEILVWFIEGYQALVSFRDSREREVHPDGITDEGFYYKTESGVVQLREPVVEKIEYLSRECEGGLKDIVATIPSLLKIKPTERLKASQLVEKLKHLGTGTGTTLPAAPSHTPLLPVLTPARSNLRSHDSDLDPDSNCGVILKVTHASDG